MKSAPFTHGLRVKIPFKRKKKIIKQFEELHSEWKAWEQNVSEIIDYPYNKQEESDVFADGKDNMNRHMILQNRTLNFLGNNIENHWFIVGIDGEGIDREDLRLIIRVQHRIQELEQMKASLNDMQSYWGHLSKQIFDHTHLLINEIIGIWKDFLGKLGL